MNWEIVPLSVCGDTDDFRRLSAKRDEDNLELPWLPG